MFPYNIPQYITQYVPQNMALNMASNMQQNAATASMAQQINIPTSVTHQVQTNMIPIQGAHHGIPVPVQNLQVKTVKRSSSGGQPKNKPKIQKTSTGTANLWALYINPSRIHFIQEIPETDKLGTLYWMQRDQRVQDNWAMLCGQMKSMSTSSPFHVCITPLEALPIITLRHMDFYLKGLREVEKELRTLNIPFVALQQPSSASIVSYMKENGLGVLVTDFSPLCYPQEALAAVVRSMPDCTVLEVDSHNIVPVWISSDKQEFSARTMRPKIEERLYEYMTEYPRTVNHPHNAELPPVINWEAIEKEMYADNSVTVCDDIVAGTVAAHKQIELFFTKKKFKLFENRNDPNVVGTSKLSPWIHFGQVSAQTIAKKAKEFGKKCGVDVKEFLEDVIIRKELSDNFCYYNKNYGNIAGCPDWAIETLRKHSMDKRPFLYSTQQLEESETHDELWNAAQTQLKTTGRMHGFVRMYWAKKILEWTHSPEQAIEDVLYLNDKYSLDGSDPNGYAGCLWAIGGLHDQGWDEREIFGRVRYLNFAGYKKKFDVDKYVNQYTNS